MPDENACIDALHLVRKNALLQWLRKKSRSPEHLQSEGKMVQEKPTTEQLFDGLRDQEEKNFQGLKRVLGESFGLMYDLLHLYDVFFKLALKPVAKLDDVNQIPALLHSLQWMKHEAIAGTMTLMRGHITDSSNFSRRALEICAFIVHMYSDQEAAKRWMEAGTSNKARDRYVSAFPAWKLVKVSCPQILCHVKRKV